MSRRNRRQQEELQNLQAAVGLPGGTHAEDGQSTDEDELDEYAPQASSSKFAALLAGGQEAESSEDTDLASQHNANASAKPKKKRNKKKKTKPLVVANDDALDGSVDSATSAAQADSARQTSSKSAKKKGKKRNKSGSLQSEEEDDGLDEIDRALKQLGEGNTSGLAESVDSNTPIASSKVRTLLSVDTNQLDADAELKRFFGAKVVASAEIKPQVRGARAQNPHHALHRQFARGGILAKPKPNWPPAAFSKSGLSMTLVEALPGETVWTFEHSRGYKEVTQMYLEAVSSMDPNQMMAMLHVHPYHVETLLGLSDMAAQQGDPGMSQDFLDRALYAFEKAFAPNFNIQNGNVRLDFSRIESRGFYRALEKRINSTSRRGTWRTLFEHCKLLYALDFTAPKSRQYTWFINFMEELPSTLSNGAHEGHAHLQVDSFPGLHYAKALCMWHKEGDIKAEHAESTRALRQAILKYPLACHLLLQKLQTSIPAQFATLTNARPESGFSTEASYILQLLSHLYVHRSDTLWAEPEVKEWLQQTVRNTVSAFSDSSNPDVAFGLQIWRKSMYPNNAVPQGILRHVLVSDIQALRSFLPQSVLSSMSFTFDPLPPGPGFDDEYFKAMYEGGRKPTRRRSGNNASEDDEYGGTGTDFVQRLMQYLQTGGEGGRGLDPDTEAAVVAQLEQFAAARGDGLLPGNFPGSRDEGSEEEGDMPDAAGLGFMNFFRGLWQTDPQVGEANNPPETRNEGDGGSDVTGT